MNKANLENLVQESIEHMYEGSSLNHLQCAIVVVYPLHTPLNPTYLLGCIVHMDSQRSSTYIQLFSQGGLRSEVHVDEAWPKAY